MTEEKTNKSVVEMEAEVEKEVITINRAQFIEAMADVVTDEPISEIVSQNPMLIMIFAIVQRMLWEKCVELIKPTDPTDKKEEKEDVDDGQIRSE